MARAARRMGATARDLQTLIRPAGRGHPLPQSPSRDGRLSTPYVGEGLASLRRRRHGTRFWVAAAWKNEALTFGVRFKVA